MFKKGQKVAKAVIGAGYSTVAFGYTVSDVKDGVVEIEDSSLTYDKLGNEIDSAIPGFTSQIASEADAIKKVKAGKWNLDDGQKLPTPLKRKKK